MGSGMSIDLFGDDFTYARFRGWISVRGIEGCESADHGRIALQTAPEFLPAEAAPLAGHVHEQRAGRHQSPLPVGRQQGAGRHRIDLGHGCEECPKRDPRRAD